MVKWGCGDRFGRRLFGDGKGTDSGRVGHGRLRFLPVGRASGARAFEWGN